MFFVNVVVDGTILSKFCEENNQNYEFCNLPTQACSRLLCGHGVENFARYTLFVLASFPRSQGTRLCLCKLVTQELWVIGTLLIPRCSIYHCVHHRIIIYCISTSKDTATFGIHATPSGNKLHRVRTSYTE